MSLSDGREGAALVILFNKEEHPARVKSCLEHGQKKNEHRHANSGHLRSAIKRMGREKSIGLVKGLRYEFHPT